MFVCLCVRVHVRLSSKWSFADIKPKTAAQVVKHSTSLCNLSGLKHGRIVWSNFSLSNIFIVFLPHTAPLISKQTKDNKNVQISADFSRALEEQIQEHSVHGNATSFVPYLAPCRLSASCVASPAKCSASLIATSTSSIKSCAEKLPSSASWIKLFKSWIAGYQRRRERERERERVINGAGKIAFSKHQHLRKQRIMFLYLSVLTRSAVTLRI